MARAALSLPFSGLSGSLGDTVIVQLPDGPQVRRRVPVRKGRTPAQGASRLRIEAVSRAWADLDEGVFQAWRRYALSQAWRNPATGAIVTPRAYCLFCGLAAKAMQVDGALDLAGFLPPERAFSGDGVLLSVTPSSDGSFGRGGRGERLGDGTPTSGAPPSPAPSSKTSRPLPLPPLQDEPLGEGVLRFSASGANVEGVVTELLVQPLVNARRAVYMDKYVSKGFVHFEGPGTTEVPVAPGAWACAYRFLRAATGQETAIFELGVVRVGVGG